jgi:hypothetical protein
VRRCLFEAHVDALATLLLEQGYARDAARHKISIVGIAGYSANKTVRLGTKARGYRPSDRLLAFLETL